MTDNKRKWRDKSNNYERHYCDICNVWMGSDRQSILLHENGKKHMENVERQLQEKRREKTAQDTQAAALAASLKQMEAAARSSVAQDLGYFAHVPYASSSAAASANAVPSPPPATTSSYGMLPHQHHYQQQQQVPLTVPSHAQPPPPPPPPRSQPPQPAANEKKEWETRKKQRLEEKTRKAVTEEEDEADNNNNKTSFRPARRHIDPNEGHYTTLSDENGDKNNKNNKTTYLEATVFGDILEEDMPIQLWTGAANATLAEQRLPDRALYWKDALVAAVRQQRHATTTTSSSSSSQNAQQQQLPPQERLRVDVAYLQTPDATEETLERSVPLNRIRIVLGADEKIPDTLEEARLMAMGGEVVLDNPRDGSGQATQQQSEQPEIDETTGLSAWSTVSVKRTTVRQELKEERERLREQRRQAALEAEQQKKQAEFRRMEEAKLASADDSALGAFDVWNRGVKEGYKGIDIHSETKVEVHELGKKLADSDAKVGFKKMGFKAKKKNQNRRTTSADDD